MSERKTTTRSDEGLSLALDEARHRADEANLAACDAWTATQHFAFEAIKQAGRRDEALAEVVRLEALMPEEGSQDE